MRDNKPTVLIISIAFSMICNYYITCMALVFTAVYSIIRLTELNRWSVKKVVGLFGYVILGLGLSMPVVLPGILALKYGKMDEASEPLTKLFRYNIIEVLGQLFSGRTTTAFDDGLTCL